MTLLVAASPYQSDLYVQPGAGVYVDSYQDDAFWPDLAHGITGIVERIRAADVLLLGSSKMLFGLSAGALESRQGGRLRAFNLGIGGGEGVLGMNTLIERLDLRGRTLVVNLDNDMLSDALLGRSQRALALDRFQAATRVHSVRWRAIVETWFDRIGLPHTKLDRDGLHLGPRHHSRTYRDARNGDALPVRRDAAGPPGERLAPAPPGQALAAEALDRPHVRRILASWNARGMRLVFLTVPYANGSEPNDYNPDLPQAAARRYGGRAVQLDWRTAHTQDGIHVDRASRDRLSRQLADAF